MAEQYEAERTAKRREIVAKLAARLHASNASKARAAEWRAEGGPHFVPKHPWVDTLPGALSPSGRRTALSLASPVVEDTVTVSATFTRALVFFDMHKALSQAMMTQTTSMKDSACSITLMNHGCDATHRC